MFPFDDVIMIALYMPMALYAMTANFSDLHEVSIAMNDIFHIYIFMVFQNNPGLKELNRSAEVSDLNSNIIILLIYRE